jgi:hypothetical protein
MNDAIILGRILLFVGFVLVIPSLSYSQPKCQVESGQVNAIRLGDSIETVIASLQKEFVVSEIKPERPLDPLAYEIAERSSQQTWFILTVDHHKKIVFVSIIGPCFTKGGVGVGSTLGQAMRLTDMQLLAPPMLVTKSVLKKSLWSHS